MEGNNELHLCAAEMIKAVEYYLKAKVLHPDYAQTVQVTSVVSTRDDYAPTFTVKLEPIKVLDEEKVTV